MTLWMTEIYVVLPDGIEILLSPSEAVSKHHKQAYPLRNSHSSMPNAFTLILLLIGPCRHLTF